MTLFGDTYHQLPAAGGAATTYGVGPKSNNLLGAPFDPLMANVNGGVIAVGVLQVVWVPLPLGGAVSAVRMVLGAAGNTLTSGQNLVGVYNSAGTTLLGTSVDQTTNWASTGVQQATLVTPTAVQPPGSVVYVAILANGTGGPNLRAFAAAAGMINDGLTTTTYRWATAGSGLTALPASIPTMSAGTVPIWVGVK